MLEEMKFPGTQIGMFDIYMFEHPIKGVQSFHRSYSSR